MKRLNKIEFGEVKKIEDYEFGESFTASLDEKNSWVECSDGNDGEKNHYKDVYIDGKLAYCDGEEVMFIDYIKKNDTVFVVNKNSGEFFIPREQFRKDFVNSSFIDN